MRVELIPPSSETPAWDEFFRELSLDQNGFESVVEDIAQPEAPENVVVRLLSPGKSGARVAVASYHDSHSLQRNWVIKLVPPGQEELLRAEKRAIEGPVRELYPDLDTRFTLSRAIAYHFLQVASDFAGWLQNTQTTAEVTGMISQIFAVLTPWYRKHEPSLKGFFEDHHLDETITRRIRRLKRTDLLERWERLRARWPRTRGILKTMCHGDFNPTNILLCRGELRDSVYLIDFASADLKHWATDFARLERQLKFCANPEEAATIAAQLDRALFPKLHPADSPVGRVVAAVQEIRKQAKAFFETAVNKSPHGPSTTAFEEEYLHMLAFQQLCLIASPAWRLDKNRTLVCDSTATILDHLLREAPRDYYFGYFTNVEDGRETILVRVDEGGELQFPISGFRPAQEAMEDTVERRIRELTNQSSPVQANFLASGFSPTQIVELRRADGSAPYIHHGKQKIPIRPFFFKVPVTEHLNLLQNKYRWVDKQSFLEPDPKKPTAYDRDVLIDALKKDHITEAFGKTVLECVDILVFRENEDTGDYEFLMLERDRPDEPVGGWEYPKGGLEYHETIHEGAIRELLEETGTKGTGGFRFAGYLGQQTADVSWRHKKQYDTLRVHGVTYMFYGREEDIQPWGNPTSEHKDFKWMSWKDAREQIWIGNYGQRFFDRWHARRWVIRQQMARPISLVFQVTEECPLGCRFCHRRIGGEKDLSLEERKEIVDILAARGILRLSITGGEPMLPAKKEETLALLEYAHSKKIHTCLSTTGFNMEEQDRPRLEQCVDQLLLSLHNFTEAIADEIYERKAVWQQLDQKIKWILEWTKESNIIVEISTVVFVHNSDHIIDLGRELFRLNSDVVWRLDEYYANGDQSKMRRQFELSTKSFASIIDEVTRVFPEQQEKKRIRFNTKESRNTAPDIMITPQGNAVMSADYEYNLFAKGKDELLFVELRNRRRWSEYRECLRTDWNW